MNVLQKEDEEFFREYFRRQAVYFKKIESSNLDEVYFQKLQRGKKCSEYQVERVPSGVEMECLVDSVKTYQYLDKTLFCCTFCGHLGLMKSEVELHVYNYHIATKRRLTEADMVINYLDE